MTDNLSVPSIKLGRHSCLAIVLALAAAVLLISKFVHLLFPPPEVPLFEPAAGLRTFSSVEQASQAGVALKLPAQTYGASANAVAQYLSASPKFPAGTTDVVYAADNARTFEVLRLPVPPDDATAVALGIGTPGPELVVGAAKGRLYLMNRPAPVCVDATPTRPLKVCQLGERLIFGTATETFIITVDGHALTEGQLIEVARSIPLPTSNVPTADCVIGGCSGELCVDPKSGQGISNCIYRAEFACYKSATCGRQADGSCGWTQTDALKTCLANPSAIK